MNQPASRTRNKNADTALPARLLDVAEAMYAAHGFGNVSLRQIGVAAGARNNFAVQYHFGDVERLTAAIVARRSLVYEVRRGALLADARRAGELTPRLVLEILERPILELKDEHGDLLGARFMVALQNTTWGWRPLSDQLDDLPVTRKLIKALEEMLPALPPPVVWQRLYLTSLMIMNCAAQMPRHASGRFRSAVLDNVFAMAAAALTAPLGAESAAAMSDPDEVRDPGS